jgi:hypothetical protein
VQQLIPSMDATFKLRFKAPCHRSGFKFRKISEPSYYSKNKKNENRSYLMALAFVDADNIYQSRQHLLFQEYSGGQNRTLI